MNLLQDYDGPSKIVPKVRGAKSTDQPFATQMAGTSLQKKEANWRPLAGVRLAPFWLFLLTFLCAFGRTSMAAPAVSYGLTTTTDPALPGKFVQFRNTVTNLTTSNQYVTLSYKVPNFTSYGGYPAGTALTYTIGYVAPGVSETVNFDFTVLSGAQTPPNGSLITLVISDLTRGLSVSRTATVQSAPTASLDLSTQQSTVAPGGSLAYTLAFHNASAGVISGSQLSLPVPAGASFVFADSGGVLGADGVIRWAPGTLSAGATRQVHVNLKAATTTGTLPALLLQTAWKNSAGQILAQASDTKAVYAIPAVFYALTTNTDPVGSGKTLQFRFTVTNLATTSQYVTLSYHVPNFTAYGGYPAGTLLTYTVGYVAPGASETVNFDFTVLSGSQTPPDGSLSTLVISDDARGASVSRTAIVRTAPTATLDLSTPQGTVAPGGNFSYTLAFHNASAGVISGSQLSLPVPVGASFVSAEGGAVLGSDGVVRLAPGTLPAGATSQVHVHLKAATAGTRSALLLQAVWKDSGGLILAQASDAKSIYSTPAVSYALTTTTDPVGSGKTLQFRTTVTNLATTKQYVTFSYHVPNFTAYGGYPAGTLLTYTVGYVAPGASETVNFDFTVLSGSQTPPDGSLSTLVISDNARGASLSRTAIVRTAPTATLDLSTPQGTVAPGGSFAYTLAFHNASPVAISGSHLSLTVPVGASFVFADAGGVLGSDGVVRWAPGTLPAGATRQVHVNFKAATTTGALPALLLEATSTNSADQILAQASDAKAIYPTPAVFYALTTSTDPVGPGKTLQFRTTVTNLSTTSQYVTFSYHVPNFTAYSGYPAGTLLTYTVGYVAPGTSETVNFDFTVLSGSQTPPDGSLSTLVISDDTRGASVSRTAIVRTAPTATLDLSTQQGTVAPGGSFTYTLAFHNASAGSLSGSQLSLPVPAGASFVSADGGGVLGSDGVVRWTPASFPAGATSQVHVNLKAATGPGARPALLLQAVWKDSGGLILAQASDAKSIYLTPAVSYSLTTTTDPIGPGKTLQFKFSATNLATTSQYVTLSYHVPNFTAYGGYPAGTLLTYTIGYVAAGVSQSVNLSFTVLSGSQTPAKGSLITLVVSDDARGAADSRTVTVN